MAYDEKAHGAGKDTGVEKYDDKVGTIATVGPPQLTAEEEMTAKHDLELTGNELEDIEHKLSSMTGQRAKDIIVQLYELHKHDQNFPRATLVRMEEFVSRSEIMDQQLDDKNEDLLLREMKIEAILAIDNSPYLEVRANVDPTDDPTMPSLTFRVLLLGTVASCAGSFIDTLFANRNPSVSISANVAQLIAYPCGKFLHKVLPTRTFTTFGRKWTLNPGPFNKKEHMLITIMANVSFSAGYTNYIIPTQALDDFFGLAFARKFGYQLLNTMGFTFVGYGLAGLTRRFLVYPSVAVWPSCLAQIALNKAFHTTTNEPVQGPFGKIWRMSREKFFLITFIGMFCYFWFPSFIFNALSYFNWISWISPNNADLVAVTGMITGVGLNPWPTFDWNILNTNGTVPLSLPTFTIVNQFIGILVMAFMTLGIYYRNDWMTGYFPINTNKTWDNTAKRFNVHKILNDKGDFDNTKYQQYSEPWMGAGYIASFIFYFAMYTATVTYVFLYHRHDLKIGFKSFSKGVRKSIRKLRKQPEVEEQSDDLYEDVHSRLMSSYAEVPEWMYLIVLVIAAVLGMVGIGVYPTNVTPAVVIFGIIMPLICIIPCGLVQAVTGMPIPLNVIAEFIGGAFYPGNANSLIYFKTYGYIAAYQTLAFCSDLKLAHYLKIPPRHTFAMQLWATLIYTFMSAGLQNFVLSFQGICTPEAKFLMTCPGSNTFFTSAVFWGTLGPTKLFGPGKRYNMMLLGFPAGFLVVMLCWALRKKWPRSEMLRQIHPVMIFAGGAYWGAPYNMSYFIGNLYVTVFSFQLIRKRWPALWAKYNYVLAASFPAGIAIAAVIIFFGTAMPRNGTIALSWWGNNVIGDPAVGGCDVFGGGCPRLTLADGEFFGAAPGSGKFT